jgi:hypothetical protein
VKAFGQYLAAVLGGIVVVGTVAWAFTDSAGRQTVLASAALALVVQMGAFAVTRTMRERHLMLGWGLGSVLRVVALVLYAVIVARLWRAPVAPALLSFVGILFVTTVVEPVFLKR